MASLFLKSQCFSLILFVYDARSAFKGYIPFFLYRYNTMAYVRKPRAKRTRTTRRFNMRKPVVRRKQKSQFLKCRRFVYKLTLAGNDTLSTGSGAVTFSLSDVPNAGEFTGLFDQWCLTGVMYRWVIKRDPNAANTATYKGLYPRVCWVHDHDSAQSTSTLNDLQQFNRMSEMYFGDSKMNSKWNYLKPACANSVYNGVYNGYSALWRRWLDSAYPAVPHYGIRYYYDALYAGISIELECKYLLKFKTLI